MRRYSGFIPHPAYTALEQIKRKLRFYNPAQDYSQAPANESFLPQELYPQEIYEPVFQSNGLQMNEPHEEPFDTGLISMTSPLAKQEDFQKESMPEELAQAELQSPEEEINAAIDEASGILNQGLSGSGILEETNLFSGSQMDCPDGLEGMLEEPLQQENMMDEMTQPFRNNPFFFGPMS